MKTPLLFGPLVLFACNVESLGGDDPGGSAGAAGCPDRAAVVLSDYLSTQVAVVELDGGTLTESLLSTASLKSDGLAFALSGDVALPTSRTRSGELVTIDGYGTNVLTWVDPKSGDVRAQLPVGTGFDSNPRDYLELADGRALVARWGQNARPGREAYDDGGDLLLVDPRVPAIEGSLVFPSVDGFPPRPSSLLLLKDRILVSLEREALDYATTGEAMIAEVDPKTLEVESTLTLKGLKTCGRPELSPEGQSLVVACTGALDAEGNIESLAQSALVFFDPNERPLRELRRLSAEDLAGTPLQGQVAWMDEQHLLMKTQTAVGDEKNNQVLAFSLSDEMVVPLLEAAPDDSGLGRGLVFGTIVCSPACADSCLVADGVKGTLERLSLKSSGPIASEGFRVETKVGLPPRTLTLL
jgi:hypothetical protein